MVSVNKLKKYFPLKNINDVLKLFDDLLASNSESNPDHNIIFISILLGFIEYKLTQTHENEDIENETTFQNNENYATVQIFTILFNDVIGLYKSFQTFVSEIGTDKLFKNDRRFINRSHLKLITDVVFSKLSVAKYKENCHNQSIFSFLTDKSLDSFGLAYTILAVTRQLGYQNVCLALSEDHAWLEYDGEDINNNDNDSSTHRFTADVAWTGKNEDKRCSSIDLGIMERSRLYLGGNSVVCIDNAMTIAAAITTINPVKGSSGPSNNAYTNRHQNVTSYHSLELTLLKRDLLWIAYNKDLLKKYPLAVINLADLERSYPKFNHDRNTIDYPLVLYREAVEINFHFYDNCHVYPYLSMANYFYHYCNFLRAMKCWRLASNVISKYNYKSEDWIIYREFFEIATNFIPNIFRTFVKDDDHMSKSSGSVYHNSEAGSIKESRKSIESKDIFNTRADQRASICEELKGSVDFLSEFLCFFDFICLWEEGSSVPVLHEVWANKFKEVLTRFNEETRVSLNTIGIDAGILNNDRSIDQILSLSSHICQKIIGYAKDSSAQFVNRPLTSRRAKTTSKKLSLTNDEVKQVSEFWKALANEDINHLSAIMSSKVLNLEFLINLTPLKMYDFTNCPTTATTTTTTIDYENLNCENLCQLKLEQTVIDYFSTLKSVKNILLSSNSDNVVNGSTDQVLQGLSNNAVTLTKTEELVDDNNNNSTKNKNEKKKKKKKKKEEEEEKKRKNNKKTKKKEENDEDGSSSSSNSGDSDSLDENDGENSAVSMKTMGHKVSLFEVFKSQKMREICPLLVAPGRLNIPAIKLPLTAQSQVSLKRTGLQSVYGSHSHEYLSTCSRKRFKRE